MELSIAVDRVGLSVDGESMAISNEITRVS